MSAPARLRAPAVLRLSELHDEIASADTGDQRRAAWKAWATRYMRDDMADLARAGVSAQHTLDAIAAHCEPEDGIKGAIEKCAKGLRKTARENRANLTLIEHAVEIDQTGADVDVYARLDKTSEGDIRKTLRNAALIVEHDTRLRKRLRWNRFSYQIELDGEPMEDPQLSGVVMWIDQRYGLDFGCETTYRAIEEVSRRILGYHPVEEYLCRVKWDGLGRIDRLLDGYMGAEDTPLTRKIGAKFMLSCVARVMTPLPVQVDTVLILHGNQGARKTSAIRVLCGMAWFGNTELIPGSKDMYGNISGTWMYEIGEFEKWLGWKEISVIKSLITSTVDKYRPPYARCDVRRTRQTVFVGTTNHEDFLTDPTGHRRFWPVTVGASIDLDALTADRDQLWAEAVTRWRAGERWWLDETEAAALAHVATRYEVDRPDQDTIREWLTGKGDRQTTAQIAVGALGISVDKVSSVAKRIAEVMRKLGWKQQHHPTRVWVRGS